MQRQVIGTFEGRPVETLTIASAAGAKATIMTFGAVLHDLIVPLPGGGEQRVVLGLASLEDHIAHSPHFGATAGRFANRIDGGCFMLDGATYQLPLNQAGKHSLHGGGKGFGRINWTAVHHTAASVTLALLSPDGDAGYPGNLQVMLTYSLEEPATLRCAFRATTDAPTIVNLAHHSYFNLDGSETILDHELEIRSNLITPVDADLIPTGEIATVAGTPYDFRKGRPIRRMGPDGARFWYDNNWMLRRDHREASVAAGLEIAHAATLRSPENGLSMQVWTTEPALQFYDGFKLSVPVQGLGGATYGPSAGLCLEPQKVPDSPNLPHFPSATLRPGEIYRQVTEYRFG